MTGDETALALTREQTVREITQQLRGAERVLLATHVHPDGDAIGSLAGMRELLVTLGKDVELFLASHDVPLPEELSTFDLGTVVSEDTVELDDRLVVFLDCGNADRTPLGTRVHNVPVVINIDHHHDNTRFGTINLVDPGASSTAELVWEFAAELGVALTPTIAEALYVGLMTDTGRFSYENVTPRAHRMAAELLEVGVDVTGVRRRLYEDLVPAKLHLLRYALESMALYGEGTVVSARVNAADFAAAGATEAHAEGIIDVLRAIRGIRIAALARELEQQPGRFKVSLRAADPQIDVSAIAHARGGGGHPQAAGFTTTLSEPELAAFIVEQLAAHDGGSAAG